MSRKVLFGYLICSLLIFSPLTSNWVKAEEANITGDQTNVEQNQGQGELVKVVEYEGVELEELDMEEVDSELESSASSDEQTMQLRMNSNAVQTMAVSFTDVPSDYWAYTNIQHLSGQEIISGYKNPEGTSYFLPDDKVTRAQAAKMVVEALGEKPTENVQARFNDVPANHWAAGYIDRAYQLGVFGGYENGSFGPNNTLKRSQMAKVLVEAWNLDYNGYTPGSPVFSDVSRSYWAYEYIEKVHYNGISNGNNFRFLPEDEITRAQFTAFLSRAIDDQFKLSVPDRNEVVEGDGISTGTVTSSTPLNVRQGPSDKDAKLGSLQKGTKVTIYAFDGYWAKISYNGKVGYVHKSYLKLQSNDSRYPLKDRIIVVDAGHGAHDPGTSSNGFYEKNITLDVAKRVSAKLQAAGANVVMTRKTDNFLTLQERVDFTKSVYGEIFVSVHVNSAGSSSAKGSETYYDTSNNQNGAQSKLLAHEIQQQLVSQANMTDRKIKDTGFYVIKYNQIPAVLVELGFLSNSEDRSKLTSETYLNKYAEAIYQGVKNYYVK
ncbi:N-acetylmuramoyl-L-alanine amidase [Cytobacillus massiliigabonensis]|uniref:N-acetylmuramoyl-L-alanine amidase n=1 Tax=Cytobacillus massiliigabonensis TaxID=1871011 RepID=UPI000C81A484|nr:N-acetylmuramoyl-L-alanine amidase [Cytobacillus massiliigabonensis]